VPYHSRVALLEVGDLAVEYTSGSGHGVVAVDGISFDLDAGEVVGLLGESGCGKTTLLLALLGLLPPEARIVRGTIRFRGRDLRTLDARERRRMRGADIAIVFQEPALALNPVRRVGSQVAEVIHAHRDGGGRRGRDDALSMLAEVGLDEPDRFYEAYPHELSGGQRQRVVLAQALACRPAVLLADEPTASLDSTTQAELRALLARLQARFGLAVLMASHDLGALAALARRVLVMYAGRLVEAGTPLQVFGAPLHPYSRGLARAFPRVPSAAETRAPSMVPIPGSPPDLGRLPAGCAFEPRCADRLAVCAERRPDPTAVPEGREVRCFKHGG